MEEKLQEQIDTVLTVNTAIYKDGDMTKENYDALITSLAMAFGAEYIADRMVELGMIK